MAVTNGLMLSYRWESASGEKTTLNGLPTTNQMGTREGITSGDTIDSIWGASGSLVPIFNFASGYDIDDGDKVEDWLTNLWGANWGAYWIMFSGTGVHADIRGDDIDGQDIVNAGGLGAYISNTYSLTEFQAFIATQNLDIHLLVKGSHDSTHADSPPEPEFPSICNNSLVEFRWDGVSDFDIYHPEIDTWTTIDSTVTTQAQLQSLLEAIYPDDNYLFAYHVTSGNICVDWQEQDVGNGSFTFSVDLQENIIIEDDAEAWVIRKMKFRNEF
jgi:hypothetical protein